MVLFLSLVNGHLLSLKGSGAHGHNDSDIELCIDDTDSVRTGPRAFASTQPGFQRVSDNPEKYYFKPLA